jgi:hypothetical protein
VWLRHSTPSAQVQYITVARLFSTMSMDLLIRNRIVKIAFIYAEWLFLACPTSYHVSDEVWVGLCQLHHMASVVPQSPLLYFW